MHEPETISQFKKTQLKFAFQVNKYGPRVVI